MGVVGFWARMARLWGTCLQSRPQPLTEDDKNPAAVALGRLGGKKGGPARAKKLTPEQRSEIARKAAQARWRNSTTEG